MKKNYPLIAFVATAAVQWFLWSRISYIIEDSSRPDSWYVQNLGLAGIALLFIAPVLRHGRGWQRVIAAILSVFPVALLGRYFYDSLNELLSS